MSESDLDLMGKAGIRGVRLNLATGGVWGTDWLRPNLVTPADKKTTDVTPLFQIVDGRLLNQLPVWAPDAAIRKNSRRYPAQLYGF